MKREKKTGNSSTVKFINRPPQAKQIKQLNAKEPSAWGNFGSDVITRGYKKLWYVNF